MLSERAIEMQTDLCVCFIDYEKAFNNVRHVRLFKDLESLGLDGKDMYLMQQVYWNQSAAVTVGCEVGEWVSIQKGGRQGCGMSQTFLTYMGNIYSKVWKTWKV